MASIWTCSPVEESLRTPSFGGCHGSANSFLAPRPSSSPCSPCSPQSPNIEGLKHLFSQNKCGPHLPPAPCHGPAPPPPPPPLPKHTPAYRAALKIKRQWKLDRLRCLQAALDKTEKSIRSQYAFLQGCEKHFCGIVDAYDRAKKDNQCTLYIEEAYNLEWLDCQARKHKLKAAILKRKCLQRCLTHLQGCISILDRLISESGGSLVAPRKKFLGIL